MSYRTMDENTPTYSVGDKVIAHTKPWSPDNIYGHGHHELWNNKVGTIILCFKSAMGNKVEQYYYHVRFPHVTYIACLNEEEMELFNEKESIRQVGQETR
jgi:hypothetical protein